MHGTRVGFLFCGALLLVGPAPAGQAPAGGAPAGAAQTAPAPRSLHAVVAGTLRPQLDEIFDRLVREGRSLQIDGTAAFNGKDAFLPGKIARAMSYLLLDTPREDPRLAAYVDGYRRIARLTIADTNQSWGIYYYLSAIQALSRAGLLEQALDAETLARLRVSLDWRTFVRVPDYTLIDLPTNYYGVAFSIARLRFLLGWEPDTSAADRLLEKTLAHYERYSGEFGFSDETDGEGRFDRYSVLLAGELCHRFLETDLEVPPRLRQWLRRSADVMLVRLNADGDGIDFGRSIGAYGDTSVLEVLSAAARLGVLTDEERDMAYAFAARSAAKYATFWYDAGMRSVNLWEKGRRTDAYRGKHRILGENLSLAHQLIATSAHWDALGYRDRAPSPAFEGWLARLPRFTLTWFARGEHDRALVTVRDGTRVISLPVVNGGAGQHANTPYFPIPFSPGLIAGVADESFPQLVPKVILADGSEVMPLAYARGLRASRDGEATTVAWRQTELDRLGDRGPVKDARLAVETTYTLTPGAIARTDRFVPAAPMPGATLVLEFASFSEEAALEGARVRFGRGAARAFSVDGLASCTAARVDEARYRSPGGPMRTLVSCRTGQATLDGPFTIRWTLEYR